jgi:hypothetical protein
MIILKKVSGVYEKQKEIYHDEKEDRYLTYGSNGFLGFRRNCCDGISG